MAAQDVTLSTELPGRTTAYLIAEVRPQIGGTLFKRLFEEGSEVKVGQPLYQIHPAPHRATLSCAEASLASAQLLSEQYDRLIEKRAISQQERDDVRSQQSLIQAERAHQNNLVTLYKTLGEKWLDAPAGFQALPCPPPVALGKGC